MRTIARGEVLRLTGKEAAEIEVREGCVWVTQEADAEDHILDTGRSFRIDKPGVTLIGALRAGALIDLRPLAA